MDQQQNHSSVLKTELPLESVEETAAEQPSLRGDLRDSLDRDQAGFKAGRFAPLDAY